MTDRLTLDVTEKPAHDAERMAGMLEIYRVRIGTTDEPSYTDPQDLLTDLMHWCDAEGLSFNSMLDSARMHHDAELTEARVGHPL